jgi:hypothetical protein
MTFNFNSCFLAIVQIFKSYFELDSHRLDFLGLRTTSTTASAATHAEHVENVAEALWLSTSLETFFTVSVVDLTLILVSQHLICNRNFLELCI